MRSQLFALFCITLVASATVGVGGARSLLEPSPELIASPLSNPNSERFVSPSIVSVELASYASTTNKRYYDLTSGKLVFKEQTLPAAAPIIGFHPSSGRYLTLSQDQKIVAHDEGEEPRLLSIDPQFGQSALLDDGEHIFVSAGRALSPHTSRSFLYSIESDEIVWEREGSFALAQDQSRATESKPLSAFSSPFSAGIGSLTVVSTLDGTKMAEFEIAEKYPDNNYTLAAESPGQTYFLLAKPPSPDPNEISNDHPGLILLNTADQTIRAIDEKLPNPYSNPTFSPDGSYFRIGGFGYNSIKVYSSATGEELLSFATSIPHYAFSEDGSSILLIDSSRKGIIALSLPSGRLIRRYSYASETGSVSALAISPDGRNIAIATDGKSYLIDTETTGATRIPVPEIQCRNLAFSPDSNVCILADLNGALFSVSSRSPEQWHRLRTSHAESLLSYSDDNVLSYTSGFFRIIENDLENQIQTQTRFPLQDAYSQSILSTASRHFLVRLTTRLESIYSETINLIDISDPDEQWETPLNSFTLQKATVDDEGKRLAAIEKAWPPSPFNTENKLLLYHFMDADPALEIEGGEDSFLDLALSPDGTYLAALQRNGNNNRIRLFRSSDGSELPLPESASKWSQLKFARNDQLLYLLTSPSSFSGSRYQAAIVDIAQGTIDTFHLQGSTPNAILDSSPDGRYLAFVSTKQSLVIIDLLRRSIAAEAETKWTPSNVYFTSFGPPPVQAIFAKDSRSLFYKSDDFSIRRWKITDFDLTAPSVACTPDELLLTLPNDSPNRFILESSVDLQNWDTEGDIGERDTNLEIRLALPSNSAARFYRIWRSEPAN